MTELIRVTDRRAASHERGFPRVPAGAPNANGDEGTVTPSAVSGEIMGAEAVTPDTPATSAPVPTAQPWAGWPAEWGTAWQSPASWSNRVSTVFSCVRLNSGAIATMTPILSRGRTPLTRDASEWREWTLNPQPELYSGWDEFAQQVDVSLEMRGNAYVMPTSEYPENGLPRTFYVMDPDLVTPRFENGLRRLYMGGRDVTDDGVLHLRYMSVAGQAAGLSPLEGARGNAVSAAALETYAANLARNGGIPWGVLSHPDRLRAGQAQLVKQEFVASRRSLDGAPAVLSGGLELKTLTLSPKDMALLDLRTFDEQRIAAAYGVPSSMVGLPAPDGMTYSNIVDRRTEHYVVTLRPIANKIANALAFWALGSRLQLRLNASEYVQGSISERVATYLPLYTAGVISAEELRELVGLPPGSDVAALAAMTSGTQ